MFALLRVPSLKSLAPLNPKNLISPCHYMQSKYNKNQNWKALIKIYLHNLFGIQTVQPCEAKIWPALSPDQNSIKIVNHFTYLNRSIRTVSYTLVKPVHTAVHFNWVHSPQLTICLSPRLECPVNVVRWSSSSSTPSPGPAWSVAAVTAGRHWSGPRDREDPRWGEEDEFWSLVPFRGLLLAAIAAAAAAAACE